MPFIHVQTNTAITDEQAKNIRGSAVRKSIVQCAEYADQQHYRNSAGYTKNSNRQNLCKLYVYRELGLEQLEFLMGNKNAVPVRDVL